MGPKKIRLERRHIYKQNLDG